MAASLALLLLAGTTPVKAERPFTNALAQEKFIARLGDNLGEHEDQHCQGGEYDLAIGMTLPPTGEPRDIRIAGPDCAWQRIAHVRKWLTAAPRSYFKPVKRVTRFKFKVAMRRPD